MAKATAEKRRTKSEKPTIKRPMSAYMFFSKENRQKVIEANPDVSFGQVGKLLGQQWRELSDAGKKVYNEKAAKDKKRYEEESKK
ncbi:high mobility group box domain-containing protein [Gongronella butleri]|nr:high mobility group box domain-containing protein [Gongronella butleri]